MRSENNGIWTFFKNNFFIVIVLCGVLLFGGYVLGSRGAGTDSSGRAELEAARRTLEICTEQNLLLGKNLEELSSKLSRVERIISESRSRVSTIQADNERSLEAVRSVKAELGQCEQILRDIFAKDAKPLAKRTNTEVDN